MIQIPQNFYRTSIKALILNDQKKFLLMLEENGLWELPGGGLDFGEDPHDCLKRELKEEAGMEVTFIAQYPVYFATGINNEGNWKTNIIYETQVKNLDFTPSEECTTIKFFSKKEALQENLYSTVRNFVEQFDPSRHIF